eukprot:1000065_1
MDESHNRRTFKNIVQRIGYYVAKSDHAWVVFVTENKISKCGRSYSQNQYWNLCNVSISHGVYDASKKGTYIELFCKELVKKIQSAQGQLQRNVDWNMLCVFG